VNTKWGARAPALEVAINAQAVAAHMSKGAKLAPGLKAVPKPGAFSLPGAPGRARGPRAPPPPRALRRCARGGRARGGRGGPACGAAEHPSAPRGACNSG